MLKTTGTTGFIAKPKKTKAGGGGNILVVGSKVINQKSSRKRENQAKTTKSKNLAKSKNHDFLLNFRNIEDSLSFIISKARLAFTKLRQAFVEALILHYFDLECYI